MSFKGLFTKPSDEVFYQLIKKVPALTDYYQSIINEFGFDAVTDIVNNLFPTETIKCVEDCKNFLDKVHENFNTIGQEIKDKNIDNVHSEETVKFPQELLKKAQEKILKYMPENNWYWTVPWAMWLHTNGSVYLNEGYTVSSQGGTVQMRVMRVGSKYKVDISNCSDNNWHPSDKPGYISSEDECYGKIIKLIK